MKIYLKIYVKTFELCDTVVNWYISEFLFEKLSFCFGKRMIKYSKKDYKIYGLLFSKWKSLDVLDLFSDFSGFSLHRTVSLCTLWNLPINSLSSLKTSTFDLFSVIQLNRISPWLNKHCAVNLMKNILVAVPAISESLWEVKEEHRALSQNYTISIQMNICDFIYKQLHKLFMFNSQPKSINSLRSNS